MTTHTETQAMCDDSDRAVMPPPLWLQIEGVFSKYGLSSPPGGLRDEIVMIVLNAWGKDSALLTRQQETIDKYRARLEVDHVFRVVDGEMVRVECPEDDYPDGIECRDVTISELEGQLDAKQETVAQLTDELHVWKSAAIAGLARHGICTPVSMSDFHPSDLTNGLRQLAALQAKP